MTAPKVATNRLFVPLEMINTTISDTTQEDVQTQSTKSAYTVMVLPQETERRHGASKVSTVEDTGSSKETETKM